MWSDGIQYYSGLPPAGYRGPVTWYGADPPVPGNVPIPGVTVQASPNVQPVPPAPERSAMVNTPAPRGPFTRMPFYPTAPFRSTDAEEGHQTRFYSQGLLRTDADYAVGAEAIRTIQFDIAGRLVAINTSALDLVNPTNYTGLDPRDLYLLRCEYTQGDRLHIAARLASTVAGTGQRPGEIGDVGWNIASGASFVVGITPLVTNLRIDVTFVVLETRAQRNFVRG